VVCYANSGKTSSRVLSVNYEGQKPRGVGVKAWRNIRAGGTSRGMGEENDDPYSLFPRSPKTKRLGGRIVTLGKRREPSKFNGKSA